MKYCPVRHIVPSLLTPSLDDWMVLEILEMKPLVRDCIRTYRDLGVQCPILILAPSEEVGGQELPTLVPRDGDELVCIWDSRNTCST